MTTISIILVAYRSAEHLAQCLQHLQRQQIQAEVEILVVDNNSPDQSATIADQAGARVIAQPQNLGFAGGVNQGVAVARGATIALINPDALAHPDWLHQITTPLADPTIGVVGGKVLGPDQRIQSLGSSLSWPELISSYQHAGEADSQPLVPLLAADAAHGAAMAFRRDLWQQLGGFDAGFFPAYWEEVDFCHRVQRLGLQIVINPRAVITHQEASSTGKFSPIYYGCFHRNRLRLAAKWLDWPTLWGAFRHAEQRRLAETNPLDVRVATEAYRQGVPPLAPLSPAHQAETLTWLQHLETSLAQDGSAQLQHWLTELEQQSIHHETVFRSKLPLVATFRTIWNNIATRWYLQPNLHQQTRFNLATLRTLAAMQRRDLTRAASDALDRALLVWRLEQTTHDH